MLQNKLTQTNDTYVYNNGYLLYTQGLFVRVRNNKQSETRVLGRPCCREGIFMKTFFWPGLLKGAPETTFFYPTFNLRNANHWEKKVITRVLGLTYAPTL